ncbi:MAG: 50S ribosome-binding GTPase [Deltaproteobacteria bacterium]|nr:50S ribosome-binding GTPase [Deltaproteobacteria bacterium]
MSEHDTLKIVIVGHVDHGKSTLIGRLFHDTGSIPEVRYREIEATCRRQGRPFEFAYLMDALEEERDQNVTIDTAQTFFKTARRPYVIIDAPGHVEFLKNMITGAASADAAILLLDGVEGVREQTQRHAYLLSLLGIRQVIVAVNKLDQVGYDRAVFQKAVNEILPFLHPLGIVPSAVVPISARDGENIAVCLGKTPWYDGPSVLEALDAFDNVRAEEGLPLRFPIQDVYKWEGRRLYVGRVETGSVRVGADVTFLPSGRRTRVKTVEQWRKPNLLSAFAGQCVGLTFEDEVFVERGEVLARSDAAPVASDELRASLFWLATRPFEKGKTYTLKLATAEVEATCVDIEERLDSSTLAVTERHAEQLETTEVGNVVFSLRKPIAADQYLENARLGRFVLEDGLFIGGGGTIRDLRAVAGKGTAQVISLDQGLTTEPDGNLVDLTRVRGALEFGVTPYFLGLLERGNRVLFRLRGPSQIEAVALLAYEHHLSFLFQRERDRICLTLYKEGEEPRLGYPIGLGL